MCFSISYTKEAIERDPRFHHLLNDFQYRSGYQIWGFHFPRVPVLTPMSPDRAVIASWGLIPGWVRTADQAKSIRGKTINARSETVSVKPSFRDSWPSGRCLVPVEGFFEPHTEGRDQTPWYVSRKDSQPFFLAGLCSFSASIPDGYPSRTFSLLTVPATGLLAEVHNDKLRMPLVLSPGRQQEWLDPSARQPDPLDTSWQMDQQFIDAWPVDTRLINSRKDVADVRKGKAPEPGLFD